MARQTDHSARRGDLSTFRAPTAARPLWATLHGHPSIWIRWTEAHEAMVESEEAITFGNRSAGVDLVGRLARCGPYGEWYVGDWRPMCVTCHGSRQVELRMDRAGFEAALTVALEIDQDRHGLDAALWQMMETLVECPDCLAHPGFVVGGPWWRAA